jgi:hypothetical protein
MLKLLRHYLDEALQENVTAKEKSAENENDELFGRRQEYSRWDCWREELQNWRATSLRWREWYILAIPCISS